MSEAFSERDILWLDEASSTNEVLREMYQQGSPWHAVITDQQTAGRGRQGRGWHTEPGMAVAFSMVLPNFLSTGVQPGWLSLLAGSAVSKSLNEFLPSHTRARVKWPNDVLAFGPNANGLKLCGILGELLPDGSTIIGMGMNLTTPGERLPGATAASLVSLGLVDPLPFKTLALTIAANVRHELNALIELAANDPRAAHARAKSDSCTLGLQVRAEMPSGDVVGEAVDIWADGSLVIATEDARHVSVTAADVWHLRPKNARQ